MAMFLRGSALAATLACSFVSAANAATTVTTGFDLLFTPGPGTYKTFDLPTIGLVELGFKGNPEKLGDPLCAGGGFDFDDGNGCTVFGNTDTILHRTGEAVLPDGTDETVSDTISLQMIALSLISVDPIDLTPDGIDNPELIEARVLKDLVAGTWIYGEDLGSSMTISQTYDSLGEIVGRTFTSELHFALDLFGASSGTHYTSPAFLGGPLEFEMTQTDAEWQDAPIPGKIYYPANTFFPGPADHCAIFGCHQTHPVPVPLPAGAVMLGGALGAFGAARALRRRNRG